MPQLLDLPAETLLQVVQFLEVEDAVSFSLASRVIYNLLTYERAFLAGTLSLTRETRPIPCAPHEDITQYDAHALRRFLCHFIRLNRNWQHDKPRIMGPVKGLKTEKGLDMLGQIPGTNYVITHSIPKSAMALWSTENGEKVCSVPCHKRLLDISTAWTEEGKFTLALLTDSEEIGYPTGIQVLTVDYGGPKVTMNISWSKQPLLEQAGPSRFRAIFLNAEVVGALYMPVTDNNTENIPPLLHVYAFNRVTGRETDICVISSLIHEMWENVEIGTSFWNGNLYIHSEYDSDSFQQWVLRELLPYDNNVIPAVQTCYSLCASVEHPADMGCGLGENVSNVESEGILTTRSEYGVVALAIHTITVQGSHQFTLINFWVIDDASLTKARREFDRLPFPSLYPSVIIPGTIKGSNLSTWYLCHASNSGTYVILLSNIEEALETRLQMVHFKLPCRRFTVHTIEVPPFVKLDLITGFVVDECRGTVTLCQAENGEMFRLNFA